MLEDNAQEDDQSSVELADDEQSDSADDTSKPGDGDIVTGEDDAADTTDDSEDDDNASDDDLDDDAEASGKKVVPYSRLRQTIEERNDLREQNKIFKAILAKQGLVDPKEKKDDKPSADLSKFSPRQVSEAKVLLQTMLKDELGLVGNLSEQLQEMKDAQEAERRKKFAAEDETQLEATLKEYKGEFTKKEVEAQIVKWHKSDNDQLKSLAKAPYDVILLKMQKMKAAKTGKKPNPAPRIPSSGADEGGSKPLKPHQSKRMRPDPTDSSVWEEQISAKAFEMMAAGSDE